MKYYVMTLRGDWKFLKQCLNLKRHPQTEKICFSCLATKGNHEPEMNFTDLRPAATWKNTVFSSPTPWGHPPSVQSLRFFDIQKIGLDLLHIWHLGVARDLCHVLNGAPSFPFFKKLKINWIWLFLAELRIGAAMHSLVRGGYFGDGGVSVRLHRATMRMRDWCKLNKKTTALRRFTADNLNFKGQQFPDPWQ